MLEIENYELYIFIFNGIRNSDYVYFYTRKSGIGYDSNLNGISKIFRRLAATLPIVVVDLERS